MPNRVQQDRAETKRREAAEIGVMDMKRLHEGMNKSGNSKEIRANKQPNRSTGRRDDQDHIAGSSARTSTSGSKRHASAGAGPSERTTTTAKREGKRATVAKAEAGGKPAMSAPTRRNDEDTKFNEKPMKGSRTKSKPTT